MARPDPDSQEAALAVTILCADALPVILKRPTSNIGGMEVRAWTLARSLATRPGMKVSLIARDQQRITQTLEGVVVRSFQSRWHQLASQLSTSVSRQSSFPWIRWKRCHLATIPNLVELACRKLTTSAPQRAELLDALRQTQSQIVVCFGVSYLTRYAVEYAKEHGKTAIVAIAWDGDLDPRIQANSSYVSPFGDRGEVTWWILKNADHIIVQTPEQQALLKMHFDRQGRLLPNPIDVDWWLEHKGQSQLLPSAVGHSGEMWLWIGRCESYHKQPQLLLDLARSCPQEKFLMVLNPKDAVLEAHLKATRPDNVTIVESIPYDAMPAVFGQARGLVNTSSVEGFPNTFLQAAVCGVPIVSLNVGEQFLQTSGAGICARGDWSRFVQAISHPPVPAPKASEFVNAQHGIKGVTDQFVAILRTAEGESSFHGAGIRAAANRDPPGSLRNLPKR